MAIDFLDSVVVDGKLTVSSLATSEDTLASAGDHGYNAETFVGGTSTATTAGRVYALTSVGWVFSNATSVATKSIGLLGVATGANSSSGMVIRGIVKLTADPGGVVGDVMYLRNADGVVTNNTVTGISGLVSRVVGHKLGTDVIFFNPSRDWIEIS